MSIQLPLYCPRCQTLDTIRIWNSRNEFCFRCQENTMDRAPIETYDVILGLCNGCHQTEQGVAPLNHQLDNRGFVINCRCQNCGYIGQMREIHPRQP